MMAPDSFHCFNFLPFELRHMIYLFATPPRFVHVREQTEDRDEFDERFKTTPVQLKLHPSIAYFARNWRGRMRGTWRTRRQQYQQLTFDTYGLSVPRTKHQPWEPTTEVPDISHHFLSENPEIAWEFVRSGLFFSTAPIPALLHATRESRQALIADGYGLAFRTRTCGPQTWFNFKTDILYLSRFYSDWDSFHFWLSGNTLWDIGQFDPQDLKRVRRLALESAAHVVSPSYRDGEQEISSILELFNGVDELFLEEIGLEGLTSNGDNNQLWSYTPVLEVDVLSVTYESDNMICSAGYNHRDLRAYKEENMGDGTRFFVDAARRFEERITLRRDELVQRGSVSPWKIPEISIVFIGSPYMCEKLLRWRWDAWNRFEALKEDKARTKAAEEAKRSIDVPKRHIYPTEGLPPSPFSEQFQDDMDAYVDFIEQSYYYEDYYDHPQDELSLRHGWILTQTLATPRAS
ncbi:hypothetical protein NUW58_g3066 [Xylaria curta]|uniref:Uncharacterized protein n=1 Tax=Xylaria curta TaxID=42375 RepID=A0ACC1PD75_9PEZI|nr:hypothetical protein NUW58_g3066 [Xylaria curta]